MNLGSIIGISFLLMVLAGLLLATPVVIIMLILAHPLEFCALLIIIILAALYRALHEQTAPDGSRQ